MQMGTAAMADIVKSRQQGFSLIEVLVTLVITLIGLLGLAGIMVQAHIAELESYQRAQALILMQDMLDKISINRTVGTCYAKTGTGGAPFFGTSGAATTDCSAGSPNQQARATADMVDWGNALNGSSESLGGNSVGSIIGARGCVVLEDSVNRIYRVSVAWQGKVATVSPTTMNANYTCAANQYGNDAQRRLVTATIRIGKLG